MLLRSRPSRPDRTISRTTGIWVLAVSSVLVAASAWLGATNYMLQSLAFPFIYFGLCSIARYRIARTPPKRSVLPERPWAMLPTSVSIAFTWGLILLLLYFFMVMSFVPWFIRDFVRMPEDSILTIRNTQYAVSTLLCIHVLLDYARLAVDSRSSLGHRTIATTLVLEFLLATHFAVY